MKEFPLVIDPILMRVSLKEVLRQLGYPDGAAVPSAFREKVAAEMADALALIEPRGAHLRLEGSMLKGLELFSGAEAVALALATIGETLEQRAMELVRRGRVATGAVMDAVGTIAVERAAGLVEISIRREARRHGWKLSRRYAPGFCGWALEAQKTLLGRFDDTLGITLTPGCLMKPEKSMSFACLFSSDGDFGTIKLRDCKSCKQDVCPYRTNRGETDK